MAAALSNAEARLVSRIRRHPKHDRFQAGRLGLPALLIAVAMILFVVLPSPWRFFGSGLLP
jgi:hypothetical protein